MMPSAAPGQRVHHRLRLTDPPDNANGANEAPMPLTAHMRQSIDDIRNYLYGGGYPDPVSNAEQLSFLFFFYLVEGIDAENKARARFLKKPHTSLFSASMPSTR